MVCTVSCDLHSLLFWWGEKIQKGQTVAAERSLVGGCQDVVSQVLRLILGWTIPIVAVIRHHTLTVAMFQTTHGCSWPTHGQQGIYDITHSDWRSTWAAVGFFQTHASTQFPARDNDNQTAFVSLRLSSPSGQLEFLPKPGETAGRRHNSGEAKEIERGLPDSQKCAWENARQTFLHLPQMCPGM